MLGHVYSSMSSPRAPSSPRFHGSANRSSLIYCEMVKTGSGSLRMTLPDAIGNACVGDVEPYFADHKRFRHIKRCYAERGVQASTSAADRAAAFVLGSVREPCSWLVSAFGWVRTSDAHNVSAFRAWLNASSGAKSYYKTVHIQHGEITPNPHVDCWTDVDDTDHFPTSTRRCLERFEAQGGRVDWNHYKLRALLSDARSTECAMQNNGTLKHTKACGTKNSPGGQLVDHEACAKYYTRTLATQVESANTEFYRAFGWAGCCNSSGFESVLSGI